MTKSVGGDPPTIKDVARLAGVAPSTVSRVINREPSVHPAIRIAVEKAIAELDYRPSPMARKLRSGRTQTLGLVLADLASPSLVDAVPVAQSFAYERDYSLFVIDSKMNRATEQKGIRALIDLRVDGILWKPIFPLEDETVELAARTTIAILGPVPEDTFASVRLDLGGATEALIDELLELGHRRIGVAGLAGLASGTGYVTVLRQKLRASGATLATDKRWTFDSRATCRATLGRILADDPTAPTALLVASPLLSPALLSIREAGLTVPGSVSLVSIGDSELAQTFIPGISTLTMDYDVQARLGMDLLFTMLDSETRTGPIIRHTSEYRRRASVGPVAGR